MINYKAGERRFAEWLRDQGIKLRKSDEHGLQQDANGWDHFSWTMYVSGRSGEVFEFPFMQGTGHTKRPTLSDLMASLLADAAGERVFEDWCGDYGYDTDSLKARQTFDAVAVHNGRLLKLFGTSDLDGLVRAAAPLLDAAGL